MRMPELRANEANGDSWDDPSEEKIRDLLGELSLDNRFLIVERLDRPSSWQHYIQVYLNDDLSYQVEYRAGGPQAHFQAPVPADRGAVGRGAAELVAKVVVAWAFDRPGWREALPWKPWRADGD